MPMNAKLVVVGGEVKTAEIKLRLPCTIGRGRGCTIMLPQALVSRQHCELFESGGQMMVRDLGSLNGTFINNQKIADTSPIRSEELLTIGTVTFRVMYESVEASAAPPGAGPEMKDAAKDRAGPEQAGDDDSAQPLEIGDFDFEETSRTSDTDSPSEPLVPAIKFGEKAAATPAISGSTTKPAPPPTILAAVPAPVMNPATPVVKPPAPGPKPPAPVTKSPPSGAKAPAAPPASTKPEAPGAKEEEDDFQDFLKSLGK